MVADVQAFWLTNLKRADRFNEWVFSQIQPHLGRNVLEVGCGNGNFTAFLAQHCDRVTGVDLSSQYVAEARSRLANSSHVKLLVADATRLNLNNAFDTIVLLDVLEHIEDDIKTLNQLYDCLEPGGKLLLKVPAHQFLYSPMDKVIGHYRRYNHKTLLKTLRATHFSEPEIWYFNRIGIMGWWLNGKVLKRSLPPSSQVSLFNEIVPLAKFVENLFSFPFGLSLFAIIQKTE